MVAKAIIGASKVECAHLIVSIEEANFIDNDDLKIYRVSNRGFEISAYLTKSLAVKSNVCVLLDKGLCITRLAMWLAATSVFRDTQKLDLPLVGRDTD